MDVAMQVVLCTLLLCVSGVVCSAAAVSVHTQDCRLNIRPNTTANSWQSSSYRHSDISTACFNSPHSAGKTGSYEFFHTSCSGRLDNGYHWFVTKLTHLTVVSSVTIKNRDDGTQHLERDLSSRASEVEVWTSQSDQLILGSEHCDARDISSHFNELDWQQCGRTPSVEDIRAGQLLTVNCNPAHRARYILLRKNLQSVTTDSRRCMGFVDMWLQISIEFDPPGPWLRNSKVSIKCPKTCSGRTSTAPVQLCLPRKSCVSGQTHIDSLQPTDYGNYTCQVDGDVVSSKTLIVQYSPAELRISPSGQLSCGAESPADATFNFATSAAEPKPVHSCSAFDSAGKKHVMRQLRSLESGERGNASSLWQCAKCSSAAKLTVQCRSAQRRLSTLSTEWTCEPPSELSIEFGQVKELKQWLEINFEFFTSSSSPESGHRCSASAEGAAAVEVTQWSDEKRGRNGAKKTFWMARVQLPWERDKVSVNCTAAQVSAWTRQVQATWQHRPSSIGATAYVLIGMATAALLTLALAGLLCHCKLKKLPEAPRRLVQAGTAHAMRYLSGAPHGLSQQPVAYYDNSEEENVYEVVRRIGATEDAPTYLF